MKGLTYFKLKSPYPGDITKNCSLDGTEIDNNFFELESRDVKTAYWQNDTLIIERMNGDIISVPGITEGCTKNLNIAYDKEQGTLYVTQDGFQGADIKNNNNPQQSTGPKKKTEQPLTNEPENDIFKTDTEQQIDRRKEQLNNPQFVDPSVLRDYEKNKNKRNNRNI